MSARKLPSASSFILGLKQSLLLHLTWAMYPRLCMCPVVFNVSNSRSLCRNVSPTRFIVRNSNAIVLKCHYHWAQIKCHCIQGNWHQRRSSSPFLISAYKCWDQRSQYWVQLPHHGVRQVHLRQREGGGDGSGGHHWHERPHQPHQKTHQCRLCYYESSKQGHCS